MKSTSEFEIPWLTSVHGSENSVISLISDGGGLGILLSSTLSYDDILHTSSSVVSSVDVLISGNL